MKRIVILILSVFFLSALPSEATNVSGVISTNTVWNLAGSPYIVTSYITVNNGVTLTVESGVTVKFNDGQYMLVYGTLNATGAVFTSNNASPTPGIWSYIQTGGTTATDVGTVFMSGCQVLYASTFSVYRGKATLTNTDLLNSSANGVNIQTNGRFKMTGGNINTNSAAAAASYAGILGNTGSYDTISGVTIQHYQYGIQLQQGSFTDLTNGIITSCNWPIYFSGAATLTLYGSNNFSGNTNAQVNLSFTSLTGNMDLPPVGLPYYIPSGLTVQHGATLTIQAGNTIKMGSAKSLTVYGHLFATETNFTSGSATPAPGDWQYFQVGSSTVSDSGWVTLNYCQVQYANYLYLLNGKANLVNTDLQNFQIYGINLQTRGNLAMNNGSITTSSASAYSSGNAIYAYGSARAMLTGVTLQNMKYGIYLGSNAKVDLTDVTVSNCQWPVYYSASADLTTAGTINMSSNVNKAAFIDFSTFSDTLSLPKLPVPYYFPNSMTVNAGGRMVIAGTNVLKFAMYKALDVNGSLSAEAGAGENIFFTSIRDDNWGGDTNNDGTTTTPAVSNWYGIRFNDLSNDITCVMRRCKLRYAGYQNIGGISMYNAGPTIDQCELSSNYYGAYMQYVSNPVFTNNTIGSSQVTPIALSYEADPVFAGNTLSFSDNAYDALGLIGGTMTADAVVRVRNFTSVPNITYLMLDNITIPQGKTLTINKGVVIKTYYPTNSSTTYRKFVVEGKLIAIGTPDSMIVFTSARDDNFGNPFDTNKDGSQTSPAIGDWGGFLFKTSSDTTSELSYCRIYYGDNNDHLLYPGTSTYRGGQVTLLSASPAIKNCVIKHNEYGVYCTGNSHPRIFSNSFDHSTMVAVAQSMTATPFFSGNSMVNCGYSAIGLIGENLGLGGTLIRKDFAGYTNITYLLLDELFINQGTYVTIDSGVVIKFYPSSDNSAKKRIEVNGGLKINGGINASGKVVLTSAKDDNEGNPGDTNNDGSNTSPANGDWGRIQYNDLSDDLFGQANNLKLKYGGYNTIWETQNGCLSFVSSNTQVTNLQILGSLNYGIWSDGNSVPVISQAVIQNCIGDPIAISLTSDPLFSDITFINNGSNGIRIIEGTLSSNATLKKRNVAGITNIAYIVQQLTINANAVLTIEPGVVIKFPYFDTYNEYNNKGTITINGSMNATGTHPAPIIFTSIRDDSFGGDTNNDGNMTTPQMGDWRYIEFNATGVSELNRMKHCIVRYGGAYSPGWRGNDVPQRTFHRFAEVCMNSISVAVDSCTFEHSGTSGLGIYGNSAPSITHCAFSNISATPVTMSLFSEPVFGDGITLSNIGLTGLGVAVENFTMDDTVKSRNFGAYNNITYILYSSSVIISYWNDIVYSYTQINEGTTLIIPEGIVFKYKLFEYSASYPVPTMDVNGTLKVLGSAGQPVVFTDYRDDGYGNPMDSNGDGSLTTPSINNAYILKFTNLSNDLNCAINHAVFKYQNDAIRVEQASPTIKNSLFERNNRGLNLSGFSQPIIDSCAFNNLTYTPFEFSLVSFPASISGNNIAGTTYKALGVKAETMAQDVTLHKRSFGGVVNIPYYFHDNFTVGTGSVLTIKPGVMMKFNGWTSLTVRKGLMAEGGASADSNIVFTDIRDDYYGGDSNSDGTASFPGYSSSPSRSPWKGIIFENESSDALCKLDHCIVRYAGFNYPTNYGILPGITMNSASPSVLNTAIHKNAIGIQANGASNPLVSNCDIYGNQVYGLQNAGLAFNINAENCWWGSNTGPAHSGNPGGTGDAVTNMVDYTPWRSNGAGVPLMGDVSLNGTVQAYDASLALRHAVGSITLTPEQQLVADVSGAAGITAYDASLILQYVVGLIQYFPAELLKSASSDLADPQLVIGNVSVKNGQDAEVPIRLINASGMVSCDIKINYDPSYLKIKSVSSRISGMDLTFSDDNATGIVRVAQAGAYPLSSDTLLAVITFMAQSPGNVPVITPVTIVSFLANEHDFTPGSASGVVEINSHAAGITAADPDQPVKMLPVFPNPLTENASLTILIGRDKMPLIVEVFDMTGKKLATLAERLMDHGKNTISLSGLARQVGAGSYIIMLRSETYRQTQIIRIVK